MKILLPVLCVLVFTKSALSQNGKPATSVNCLTDWHIGNTHSYTITHEQTQQSPGHPLQKTRNSYQVFITVIDQTENDYAVKWQYHIPDNERAGRPGLKDSLPIIEGMQIIYRISDIGIFLELVNWEEVRDDYIRLLVLSMPQAKDSATAAQTTEQLRRQYNTRELVESAMIREVQLFHTPYGYEYPLKPVIEATVLSNPFGGKALPAIQSMQATSIENNSYALLLTQEVDKLKADPILAGKAEGFQLRDSTRYRFRRPSGWLEKLAYSRTAAIKGTRQTDEYFMVIEN